MQSLSYKLQNSKNWNALEKKKIDVLLVLVSAVAIADCTSDEKTPPSVIAGLIKKAQQKGDLQESGDYVCAYQPDGIACKQLVVARVDANSKQHVQKVITQSLGGNVGSKAKQLAVWLCPELDSNERSALMQHAMRATSTSTYCFQTSKPSAKPNALTSVTLLTPNPRNLQQAFAQEQAALAGVAYAKEWANRPANYATPSILAKAAKDLAKEHASITCKVLLPKDVAKLKMGAFMSVAAGSDEPLRFIELHYKGGKAKEAPTVLVGKGVTFDTGGISLKPGAGMDEMKYDMCGAASVLGTFRALAELQPNINVVGLIPTCDNMPSGKATKPGDVVTAMDGTTIEVLNTDAEGRLLLCDALCYAKRFKPRAVIDIATLTGACVVSLGRVRSGLFANDDDLAHAIQQAGETAQDLCWHMPLDNSYKKQLKSKYADIANVGGREAGSVTAAKFLQHFTDYTWAHLDIAGTAWNSGAQKGATGRPVPLLLQYLVDNANANASPNAK